MPTVRELVTKWGFDINDAPLRRMDARIAAVKRDIRGLGRLTRNVGLAYGALGVGIGYLLRRAGNFEQIEIAFETLIQNVDKSKKLIADLTLFAQKTPFQLTGLFEATKRLLAYGIAAEDIIETLTALGNIAAGVGRDKLPNLILAFGQVRTKTRLMGQEVRQFTEAGVPLAEAVAKEMGISVKDFMKTVERGEVSFDIVNRAIQDLANGTGRFTGLMDRQSRTLLGVFSNIKDAVEVLAISVGNTLLPNTKKLAVEFLNYVTVNKEFIKLKMQEVLESLVKGFMVMLRVGKGVFRMAKSLTDAFGGLANTIKLVTTALAALVAIRVASFLGNVGLVALSAARNLSIFMLRARAAGVALLALKATALAVPILLGAAFLGLFLILEDLVAFFQGRKSVVGGLINDFDKNAPAFLRSLDKFENMVVSKVEGFVTRVSEFFTSEKFAPQRERIAEALLTAFDIALQSSAALVRIGIRIADAILEGMIEVFSEKAPGLAKFLGFSSRRQRRERLESMGRIEQAEFAASQLSRGATPEELAQVGVSASAIAAARRRVALREQLRTVKAEVFLHRNPELKAALQDATISPEELLSGDIASQLRELQRITGVDTRGLILGRRREADVEGRGELNQTNNITINGTQLTPEELKSSVRSAIDESNESLFRSAERNLRPAVNE